MEDLDPELANNLHWCLNNDVEDLEFSYSIDTDWFGNH